MSLQLTLERVRGAHMLRTIENLCILLIPQKLNYSHSSVSERIENPQMFKSLI